MDQPLFPSPGAIDVLHAPELSLATASGEIDARTQDEAMQPIGRVRVILPNAVVDQDGQAERIAQTDRCVDNWIVSGTQGLLQLTEHAAATLNHRSVGEQAHSRRLVPRFGQDPGRH